VAKARVLINTIHSIPLTSHDRALTIRHVQCTFTRLVHTVHLSRYLDHLLRVACVAPLAVQTFESLRLGNY
jgi:hypothetical protein